MASLILAAGVFTYERVQKTRTKRKARKAETAARFSELEKDNAERMSRLQGHCSQKEVVGGAERRRSSERGSSFVEEGRRRRGMRRL
ncbi:hypothetical protein G7Y79_00039g075790 [Physcia stellaris]|nr:hypothetical protein G7Y79_00039g075790 [Physcia stellaris]